MTQHRKTPAEREEIAAKINEGIRVVLAENEVSRGDMASSVAHGSDGFTRVSVTVEYLIGDYTLRGQRGDTVTGVIPADDDQGQ